RTSTGSRPRPVRPLPAGSPAGGAAPSYRPHPHHRLEQRATLRPEPTPLGGPSQAQPGQPCREAQGAWATIVEAVEGQLVSGQRSWVAIAVAVPEVVERSAHLLGQTRHLELAHRHAPERVVHRRAGRTRDAALLAVSLQLRE